MLTNAFVTNSQILVDITLCTKATPKVVWQCCYCTILLIVTLSRHDIFCSIHYAWVIRIKVIDTLEPCKALPVVESAIEYACDSNFGTRWAVYCFCLLVTN